MPIRFTPLVTGEFYHVYNRGVASQPTYLSRKDYERFLLCLSYYRFTNLPFKLSRFLQIPKKERQELIFNIELKGNKGVDLMAFSFLSNHFHLLLSQIVDGGISMFMKKVSDSYTRYFNTKHERVGPVFQGAFKAVLIEKEEQLVHLSRYIHLNPLVSAVVNEKGFLNYPWSSLPQYLGSRRKGFVNIEPVLVHFSSARKYLKFILDQVEYAKELEKVKHLILEG